MATIYDIANIKSGDPMGMAAEGAREAATVLARYKEEKKKIEEINAAIEDAKKKQNKNKLGYGLFGTILGGALTGGMSPFLQALVSGAVSGGVEKYRQNRVDSTEKLEALEPWCNITAYPVEPVYWERVQYSRLDAATILFEEIKESLTETITGAQGDVIKATNGVNDLFRMQNDFPIFMAIIDLAWFRPDVIDPGSHVPTGIGAIAYLDRLQTYFDLEDHQQTCDRMIALQKEYWPEAKRAFQPIDIEYLSCECRKYYSYVNETKEFKGKNVFRPKLPIDK